MREPTTYELTMVFGSFAFYWAVDLIARQVWPRLLPEELFKSTPRSVLMIGRHTMDVVACFIFIYLAMKAEGEEEFQKMWSMEPMQRIYTQNDTCNMLAMVQIAYQVKNLIDSYVCGDGWIFYVHHFMAGFIAFFACNPFLHAYAPFFLGHVEISTALLCVLGLFDDNHGVAGLGDMFPKTKVVMGVLFACGFIPLRCVIWPYMSYFVWQDLLEVWKLGPHSEGVILFFLVGNIILTGMQFFWLGEIVLTAKRELMATKETTTGRTKSQKAE